MSNFLNFYNQFYLDLINAKKEKKYRLTKSQLELLKLLASGQTVNEIAGCLDKKYDNIKKRVQNLYKKFNVQNRCELIYRAIKVKLISTKDIKPQFRKRFIKSEPLEIPELEIILKSRGKILPVFTLKKTPLNSLIAIIEDKNIQIFLQLYIKC